MEMEIVTRENGVGRGLGGTTSAISLTVCSSTYSPSSPPFDAVRSSVLSRRWRRVWTHTHALNLSDEQHQGQFLGIARAVLAGYGEPDIPSLNAAIGCKSNLCPATAAWLLDALECVVGSLSVMVTGPCTMDRFVLPATLQAKAVSLRLSRHFASHGVLVLPEPKEATAFTRLTELNLSKLRAPRTLGELLSTCYPD
ncbi:hypothetical protein E2562_000978 [Oryza meyeriana var. granulata]|uniref:Uncharacterized protein n=1 Tax=Oryza meyeriana var. granulata TaxID=110450 RepID=A0A6G1D0C3_9ORYZ|nr:hypothetical protein E2562_000978 [Oryza meyeriana var. granulata]